MGHAPSEKFSKSIPLKWLKKLLNFVNLSENKVIGYINRKKHAYNSHSNIGKDIWNDLTPQLKSIKFYNLPLVSTALSQYGEDNVQSMFIFLRNKMNVNKQELFYVSYLYFPLKS